MFFNFIKRKLQNSQSILYSFWFPFRLFLFGRFVPDPPSFSQVFPVSCHKTRRSRFENHQHVLNVTPYVNVTCIRYAHPDLVNDGKVSFLENSDIRCCTMPFTWET